MFDHPAFTAVSRNLHSRSATLLMRLEQRLPRILLVWLAVAALASIGRILVSPVPAARVDYLPYVLLVAAPAASLLLALHWFQGGAGMAQPAFRLAQAGRWRSVDAREAQRHPLYGTTGIMVSLLVGMLLNVLVRTAGYLATMPAIGAAAPGWLDALHFMMTADVVLLSSLYVVAFAAALRKAPTFPRFLLFVWLTDLTMQLLIGRVAIQAGIPSVVAGPLEAFLNGNVKKVLISIGLWMPYLLLSKRVNVTYRHRLPA